MGPKLGLVNHKRLIYISNQFNKLCSNLHSRHPKDEAAVKPKATRNLILIRHGQCDLRNPVDSERVLTALGRKQAGFTAERLAKLKVPIDKIVCSTMTRAQETANIIQDCFPKVPLEKCALVVEGLPCVPFPYEYWNEEPAVCNNFIPFLLRNPRRYHIIEDDLSINCYIMMSMQQYYCFFLFILCSICIPAIYLTSPNFVFFSHKILSSISRIALLIIPSCVRYIFHSKTNHE